MEEVIKDSQSFIGYEYKEVVTNVNQVSFLIDGYMNFGWVVDDNINTGISGSRSSLNSSAILRLKRNRKIINKMELTRLQRNFEFCLKEINQLEASKTSKATMYALIVGVIGTIFMAGAVFAVTADPPMIALCILLAIPAFAGWIMPCFIYKEVYNKSTEKANQLIEDKKEEIFEICEKGNKLLH